jgi:xanthine/uracil/vitamin C permease (AzgA family)
LISFAQVIMPFTYSITNGGAGFISYVVIKCVVPRPAATAPGVLTGSARAALPAALTRESPSSTATECASATSRHIL